MDRRAFIGSSLAAAAATPLAASQETTAVAPDAGPFGLRYAPHFGMFRHHAGDDLVDQLAFMADQGFTALEDNGMAGRSAELQERIAAAMERLGMQMGVFVAHADFGAVTFAAGDDATTEALLAQMRRAVEVARRVRARWCTVVPGRLDLGVDPAYQFANVVENLRRCCDVCEPEGLVMVLEPLNRRDHPGLFLTGVPQAYAICRAVGSPSCRILDDLYHQQITEGNLIPNIDAAWDEIAYFQVGDNPGRREPTTGEINYRNVFRHLKAKGYAGIVGMEHGVARPGREGESALIAAYRACDA